MNHAPPDILDQMAGITGSSPLYGVRRQRPDYVKGANTCRASVLSPSDDHGLPPALRLALALRMARLIGVESHIQHYQQYVIATPYQTLAAGQTPPDASRFLLAILAHCDNVTQSPASSQRQAISHLQQSGLTSPQIVALSELIAFINYESRVAAGLGLLRAVL